jgi:hypothetical protein
VYTGIHELLKYVRIFALFGESSISTLALRIIVVVVSMGFRDKPRMYFSLAGFLYRPLWTFQLWPLDASAPTALRRRKVELMGGE